MKKGFTLIEMMSVIVIIALISLLAFPNIVSQIKKGEDITSDSIKSIVISAAKKYVADNPEKYDDAYCIPISELVSNNYIKLDIVNNEDNDISKKYVVYYNNKYDITENGYKKVEYIESTGTQWIDSKVNYSYNTKINLTVESISNRADIFGLYKQNFWTIGLRVRNNVYEATWLYNENGQALNAIEILTSTTPYNNKINITLDKTGLTVGDEKILTTKNEEFSTINKGITIGNVVEINNGSTNSNSTQSRIYYFKIYDNNKLVRDFIPVLDKNNIACLYDKVEGKFYYNDGEGDFLYG